MSIETIRSNLKTLLETITEDNGYENDIGDVLDEFVYSEGTTYPAVIIMTPETDFADLSGRRSDLTEKVFLYVLVKDENTPQASMLLMRKDIIKALFTDTSLSGACRRFRIIKTANAGDVFNVEGFAPGFKPPFGCLRVECEALHQISLETGA